MQRIDVMNTFPSLREMTQPWRMTVCAAVAAFLALGAATHSFKVYHLFTLLAIPGALVAAEGGRRFFFDWGPLMATWITYDRLRLVQPALLARVAVEWPYALERAAFGWLAGGDAPPHAARAWLAAHAATPLGASLSWGAQLVYLSHLFVYPALFLFWWLRGRKNERERDLFVRHVRAFTILNIAGFVCYVLVPAAPPWWVSIYGDARPTPDLVAHANLAAAMDGTVIRHMIQTAPNWFAAFPSLHGGYPVLLAMLAWRRGSRRGVALAALYGAAMWAATVALNQHYLVDLVAGAGVALAAGWVSEQIGARRAAKADAAV